MRSKSCPMFLIGLALITVGFCLLLKAFKDSGGLWPASPTVLELNDTTSEDMLKKSSSALVLFYTPWCIHSAKTISQFARAAEDFRRTDSSIDLMQVDCSYRGRKFCDFHQVRTYPALKFMVDGKFIEEYRGPRTFEGLSKYLRVRSYIQKRSNGQTNG